MGVLFAAGAGGAFLLGRVALEQVDLIPQKAMETLKDAIDRARVEWDRRA